MKKIICIILTLALLLSCVPMSVFAAVPTASGNYIEIVSSNAILRTGPGKTYTEVESVDLHPGDCLALTNKAYTINRYGNRWYQVLHNNQVLYLYEQHATFHEHDYLWIEDGLRICQCGGYLISENSSIMQTSALVAGAGTLLTPEVLAGIAQLAAAATAVANNLSNYGPAIKEGLTAAAYGAITAIGTVHIYMAVNSTGTKIEDIIKIASLEDAQKMMKRCIDLETYYPAVFCFGDVPALVLANKPMDLDSATAYLEKCVHDPLGAYIYQATGRSMLNIYTFTDYAAKHLCLNFTVQNKSYTFANSSKVYNVSEHDHTYKKFKIYFEHYHIYFIGSPFNFIKNRDIHILFGDPLSKNQILGF